MQQFENKVYTLCCSEEENMGFWYQRTQLEKKLIVSISIFFLLSVGLLIGLIIVKTQNTSSKVIYTLLINCFWVGYISCPKTSHEFNTEKENRMQIWQDYFTRYKKDHEMRILTNDESLLKLYNLRVRDLSKQWRLPTHLPRQQPRSLQKRDKIQSYFHLRIKHPPKSPDLPPPDFDDSARLKRPIKDQSELICQSEECLIAAAEIQSSLDTTADPCQDFYQFACGGWMKKNVIAPDRSRWSQFDVTRKKLLDNLRVILDNNDTSVYPPIIGKTIGLFNQCSLIKKRDEHGTGDLKDLVTNIKWPMLDEGQFSPDYNWPNVYAQLNKDHGFGFIFSNHVYLDAKNTTIYSLYVDAPSLGVGRAQLTKPDEPNNKRILEAYKTFIRDTVLHLAKNYTTLESEIDEIIDFEKSLAAITTENSNRRNRTELYGNKTNLNEFITNYSELPLIMIEQQVFKDTGMIMNDDTELIVYDRPYFEKLGAVLKSTKSKTIANYLGWRTVQSLSGYTTKAMRDIIFEFSKARTGVEEQRALWEECVDAVNGRLAFAVGRLYVDQHFSAKAKEDMNQMINQLNVAFRQLLEQQNDWMERETKDRALNKLEKMLRAIGFPEFLLDDTKLEDFYKGFNFNEEGSYLNSIVSSNKWAVEKSLRKLNTFNIDRTQLDWSTGPAIVNAFFSPNINRITFPAGILQSPFYTLGLPISLNLGAIGVVIGHEITHSFDDSGSQYDEYGNLKNWWDNITKEKFQERVQCFKDQYSSYNDSTVGIPVNGNLTIGENIADNGGLRQAFRALENYSGNKPLLPASMWSFTNEQLFFLSFANVWCTNIRDKALINQIETDPHSPGKYRVWGSVSNSESFAKAFKCKPKTNMNPESKCILW